jgi:hypothetical protein
MKKILFLFHCLLASSFAVKAQNADNLYYNSLASGYDYQAASFVIDTALPAYNIKRAMLLWSTNTGPNALTERSLSLDETLNMGMPVTQHINPQSNALFRNLQPKKIIRSRFTKHYYLLAYVINSSHPINNIAVASSAFVLKLDDNLNLVWSSKIHFNPVTANNAGALIEYNDIIEARNGEVIIAGRYARTQTDRQALQIARLNQNTGLQIWWYWYYLWSCHANGLSIAEASNGELAVTGYAEQCTPPTFTGNRQLLYARTTGAGFPVQFRKFLHPRHFSGDKITRFISVAGADRFFITGFIDIPTPIAGIVNRQNLVVDISQNGVINRAAHFGEAPRSEEVNDHMFSKLALVANTYELYLTGYTNSYTTTGVSEAYFNVLRYNSATLTFAINRYDVMRNVYPANTAFLSRRGIEVKNAGPRRFAILTNSLFQTLLPTYNHNYTTVFVRDLTQLVSDTICYRPKTPPLVNLFVQSLDTAAVWLAPNYGIYPEIWTTTPKIPYKPICGTNWIIFPGQAINAMVNPPDEIAPADNTTARQSFVATGKFMQSDALFPNPAGSEVTITLNKVFAHTPKPISIRLLSPEMRQLRIENISYKTYHTISLSGLLPGMYIIEVLQGNNKKLFRFVKE